MSADRVVRVLRRLGELALLGVLLTMASFLVTAVGPGDAAQSVLRIDTVATSQADLEAARSALGLHDPIPVRYLRYVQGLAHGDLGTSVMTGRPVATELAAALPATGILAGVTLLVTAVTVVLLGFLAARFHGTAVDRLIMACCYVGASVPTFWLGLVLIDLLAVRVHLLPSSGWHHGTGLVLPVAALTVAIAPPFIKIFRARYLELSGEEFVRAARARGIPGRLIARRHITRGALIPVVTMLGVSLGSLLSGSVVAEAVFGLPGMGRLAVEAATRRDYAVIQGFVLVVGAAVIVVTALVELACRLIDPSARLQEAERT